MNENELRRRYPGASSDFVKKNCDHPHSGKAPKLESNPGNEPLAESEIQKGDHGKFLVRVTSVRKRLLDEDNLCEKYHVDCCRYAGLLQSDDPSKTTIETKQRKTHPGEQEATEITIEEI